MRESGSDFVEGELLVNAATWYRISMSSVHKATQSLVFKILFCRPLSSCIKQQFQETGSSRRRCVNGSVNLLDICDP